MAQNDEGDMFDTAQVITLHILPDDRVVGKFPSLRARESEFR